MTAELIRLDRLDRSEVALVGGKAANLGELTRIDGVTVPPGFCVTTGAFRRFLAAAPVDDLLAHLARLRPGDRTALAAAGDELRTAIEHTAVPDELAAAILAATGGVDADVVWAVRSSATAEDLPGTSFAGQHDTFLDVPRADLVDRVRRCWASLFTERAIAYRQHHGIDHRGVDMAVIVQEMVVAHASGVLFTADPVSSDRTVVAIEAVPGVGDDLVAGRSEPEVVRVRDGEIVDGPPTATIRTTLTDAQAIRLAALGRRIEAHLGSPQDIEWCRVDDDVRIVQSRPITTLFPIPAADDDARRVYVSVGHQQMMTDAMKPLGLSLWLLTTPAPMVEAGSRLFVDVTPRLVDPSSRAALLEVFGRSDPLIRDALQVVLDRDVVPTPPDDGATGTQAPDPPAPIETDPAIVTELIEASERSVATCALVIGSRSGPDLFDAIRDDLGELRRLLFDPRSHQVFTAAMEATWWLNEHLEAWLGEKNVADVLTRSVPRNVTSEMGLELLDVADVFREHPDVVAFLHDVDADGFLDELGHLDGGPEARAAIEGFLDRYGMRGVGEIDITRPRWRERPASLLPLILAHVEHLEPGEAARRFERGRRAAAVKSQEVLERLRGLPDGERKAAETVQAIDRVRTFIGYREYPKYAMVSRYAIYKQALVAEAERLVDAGVIGEVEDIHFLRFDELHEAVRTGRVDVRLIDRRKEAFRSHVGLTPPRVLTSDGEAVAGSYRRDALPPGALPGLAVSSGTVEGRARVVLDLADADLEPGDILVTAYTDPSWTPLFVSAAGLVTEVGGMMTHGAVVAREYGLPAVVGVERATERIRDGQRLRLHGTDGYVTLADTGDADALAG